jgi:cytosine/adenosine deaminase-related metal-dependent hydrolase
MVFILIISLFFQVQTQIALYGGTYYNGYSPQPISTNSHIMYIKNGLIEKIERISKNNSLTGYQVINITGKYVTPGLIDGHIHFYLSSWAEELIKLFWPSESPKFPPEEARRLIESNPRIHFKQFLRNGVTCKNY